ncbi:Prostasin [Trichinella papuae]|uniref:Prostasin n=1 Tax=Trichinella papuae TaxID=268474 RepID=A0A0V1N779_9BILA|nr:Prostasin [Trichinella papuae]
MTSFLYIVSFSFLLKLHLILSEIVNSPYCGKSVHQEKLTYHEKIQNRIVGGWKAYHGSLPWMVHLTFPAEEGLLQMCGGSLISIDGKNSTCLVLTAAHCVKVGNQYKEPGDILVAIGQNHLKRARDEAIFLHVKNYVSHFFHDNSLENDIAILRLDKWVLFTKYVRPLCLPSANMKLPIEEECYAAGWGRTKVKKEKGMLKIVKVRFQMSQFCPKPFIKEKMLCAGNLAGGHDVCNGDSGGPLFCMVGDRFYLFGIVSFGYKNCALQGTSSAFVRVSGYLDWIERTALTLKNIKINNKKIGTVSSIFLPKMQSKFPNSMMVKAHNSPFDSSPSRLIAAMSVERSCLFFLSFSKTSYPAEKLFIKGAINCQREAEATAQHFLSIKRCLDI